MPWKEVSLMQSRRDFVSLAMAEGAKMRPLCRRFGISPKTGYKWLARALRDGSDALADRSRRPHISPRRTPEAMEQRVIALRCDNPAWGGRKLNRRLRDLGHRDVPSPSTITEILRRHGLLDPAQAAKHRPCTRFEHEAPNDLWQMDFKGHFALEAGGRCHPLTVLDDHSRFALCLRAYGDERTETVRSGLIGVFERFGLPRRILCDNGSPWGNDIDHPHTPLGVWLIRLGIGLTHGRPHHPQTQGKDERFHRTLLAEAVRGQGLRDLDHCQRRFDTWREVYNHQRPHEALGLGVPASRYAPSAREYTGVLAPIEYGPDDAVRRVQCGGQVHFQGRLILVPKAFRGQQVAVRPTDADGHFSVHFCHQRIAAFDLRQASRPRARPAGRGGETSGQG